MLVYVVAVVASSSLVVGSPKPYYQAGSHYHFTTPFDTPTEPQSFVYSDDIKRYDHHEEFMGPEAGKILKGADLDRGEQVVIVGSALGPLMKAALERSHDSGLKDFKDISMAIIGASRQVLESRVANGRHVSKKQFEDLQGIAERLPAVIDAVAATFDEYPGTMYSLTNFFKVFNFDAVERAKMVARVLPSMIKTILQATDTTTAENFANAYNIFLPAIRKFMEERRDSGKRVTQQQWDYLDRAERLVPSLMQAFVVVDHEPLLLDFMRRMNLDPVERAKYLVNGFFASMDAIFRNPTATVAEMMRDTTLAYMPASRQVFEDRLAQGKPVTQENFDNLERMEKTLPIILDTYVKVLDDLSIS